MRCPQLLLDTHTRAALRIWSRWKRLGMLPYPGDIQGQPQWVAEILETIEEARAEELDRQHQERLAKQQRESGKG